MDNKAVETFAINAVQDRVTMSMYLEQFIADNDRVPFYNGHIYLYSDKGKRKADYVGRVAVQITGTQSIRPVKRVDSVKYPVETADLRNYLLDDGVFYFTS